MSGSKNCDWQSLSGLTELQGNCYIRAQKMRTAITQKFASLKIMKVNFLINISQIDD